MVKGTHLIKLEIHRATDTAYSWGGADGYTLPAGSAAITVTFQVDEHDGHFQTTIVLRQRFEDYNAVVAEATKRLMKRLEGHGKYAASYFAQKEGAKADKSAA